MGNAESKTGAGSTRRSCAVLLVVFLAGGCLSQESGYDVTGFWQLAPPDGAAKAMTPTLNIAADGTVSGRAPCNRYVTALYRRPANAVFAPIGATRMACPALPEEQAFFGALAEASTLIRRNGILILSTPDGRTLVFLSVPEPG